MAKTVLMLYTDVKPRVSDKRLVLNPVAGRHTPTIASATTLATSRGLFHLQILAMQLSA